MRYRMAIHKLVLLGIFLAALLLGLISKILEWNAINQSISSVMIPEYSYVNDIEWMNKMETKYAKMNSHMKKICRKYNTTGAKHIGQRHWLIDTRHQLAHCLRSKHGSTGWIKLFNSLLPIDEREGKRARIVDKYIQWFKINKNKTNSTNLFPDILKHDDIFTFTFTRHPFERLVSFYNRNVVELRQYRKYHMKTFSEYLDSIIKGRMVSTSWRNSWKECNFCFVNFNIVGRMESYEEDFRYIIVKNNLSHLIPLQKASIKSNSPSNKNTHDEALEKFSLINKTTIEKLYHLYQMDFELFDYNIDMFL